MSGVRAPGIFFMQIYYQIWYKTTFLFVGLILYIVTKRIKTKIVYYFKTQKFFILLQSMATPPDLLYRVYTEVAGVVTYYKVDASGNATVAADATDAILASSPEEWLDTEQGYDRSTSTHGIFTELSNEYTCVGDMATIIRFHWLTYGYSAQLKFRVDELVHGATSYTYKVLSINNISFEEPEADLTGIAITLYDTGIGADLMANMDTPVEIPLSGGDVVDTIHEGTTLKSRLNFRYAQATTSNTESRVSTGRTSLEAMNILIAPTVSEGLRPVVQEQSASGIAMGQLGSGAFYGIDSASSEQYGKYLFQVVGQTIFDIRIDYKTKFRWKFSAGTFGAVASNATFKVWYVVCRDKSTFTPTLLSTGPVTVTVTPGVWVNETIDTATIFSTMTDGERMYVVIGVDATVVGTTLDWGFEIETVDPEDSIVSFTLHFDSKPSQVQGFRWFDLFTKTITTFAAGKYGTTPVAPSSLADPSTFIKGNFPYRTILTNGLSLKGASGTSFKLTPGDMFKDSFATWGTGLGAITGQVFLDTLDKFYDDTTEIVDIGELSDWKLTPMKTMASKLIFGGKVVDTDILNGVQDFNTQSTFKVPVVLQTDSTIEYISPFISSIYTIEKLRVEEYGKDNTGNLVNDEVYKYEVLASGFGDDFPIRYSSVDYHTFGVDYPSRVYNTMLSPGNCRNRLTSLINSNTYPSILPLTFQTSERYDGVYSYYFDYSTSMGSLDLYENANIQPSSTPLIYLPFILKGRSVKPLNLRDLMTANPYGYVKMFVVYKGKTIDVRGFIKKVRYKPIRRNEFDWEFILTPTNVITQFI